MNVSNFEFINVLIAVSLIVAILRSQRTISIFLLLFLYGTIHFGFSSLALLSGDSTQVLIKMHTQGAGVLALVSGLSVLIVSFATLAFRAYQANENKWQADDGEFWVIVVALVFLLAGYCLNRREGDLGQVLNVASTSAMLILVLLSSLSNFSADISIRRYALVLTLFLLVVTGFAVYEVFSHKAWSVFWGSGGVAVYRASSILFNPNLLAYWASLIYIAVVYAWHVEPDRNHFWVSSMILAAIAIYMSGSRSGLALLLGSLLFATTLFRSKKGILACGILVSTIAGVYGVAVGLPMGEPWSTIAVLGERYQMAFVYLYSYLASFFGPTVASHLASFFGSTIAVPPEVEISIEGRFAGEYRDAGWLVLHQDTGWLGVLALSGIMFFMLIRVLRNNGPKAGPAGACASAALLYCALSGLVMRFQIFPVWLFFGIVMMAAAKIFRLNQNCSK